MGECSIVGCNRPSKARGWCQTHYMRWYDGRYMRAPLLPRGRPDSGHPIMCTCDQPVPERTLLALQCGVCRRGLPDPESKGQLLVIVS